MPKFICAMVHDSLDRLFPDRTPEVGGITEGRVFTTARNSYFGFQVAFCFDQGQGTVSVKAGRFKNEKTGKSFPAEIFYLKPYGVGANTTWSAVIGAERKNNEAGDVVRLAPFEMMELLEKKSKTKLKKGETGAFYVRTKVPLDITPGMYTIKVILSSGRMKTEVNARLRVYSARIPEKQTLDVVNWSYLEKMHEKIGVKLFSKEHFAALEKMADLLRVYKQNVFLVPIIFDNTPFIKIVKEGNRLRFDFSFFDRFVSMLLKKGFTKITGSHVGGRPNDVWTSPTFVLRAYNVFDENGKILEKVGPKPVLGSDSESLLRSFLPALRSHLKEKGWLDIYYQHGFDEPTDLNADYYNKSIDLIKKYFPGIKMIEAVITKSCSDKIELLVPVMDFWDKNLEFYEKMKKKGKELWFYTCSGPKWGYPNRFLDYHLLKTRILHWFNYKYGATGYLHWGLDVFGIEHDVFKDTKSARFPPGDCWIMHYDKKGFYPSMRFEAMRSGVEDYELLKLAEKNIGKKAVKELSDLAVRGFQDYVKDIEYFEVIRKKVLEAASKK